MVMLRRLSPLLGVVLCLIAASPLVRADAVCGISAAGSSLAGARTSILPLRGILRGGGDAGVEIPLMEVPVFEATAGATPLLSASREGNVDLVKKLLSEGAAVDEAFPTSGATPLLIAAGFGHAAVVRELLEAGASVNHADEDGDRALHGAAAEGVLESLEFLLAKGADVNLTSKDGTCALLIAAQRGHLEVVKLLVGAGADVNIKHEDGTTPLQIATEEGHTEVMAFLADHGGEFSKKAYGQQPNAPEEDA